MSQSKQVFVSRLEISGGIVIFNIEKTLNKIECNLLLYDHLIYVFSGVISSIIFCPKYMIYVFSSIMVSLLNEAITLILSSFL